MLTSDLVSEGTLMGGKRFRWIYFQIGQLALLSIAAFAAACAIAIPAGGTLPLTHLRFLEGAEMSVMLWIPSLALWLIVKRRQKRRLLRDERELLVLRLGKSKPAERKAAIRARMRKRFERLALRERRRDRYELFPTLFVVVTSSLLTGFYGLLRDPVALKARYPGFYVNTEFVLPIAVLAFAFGILVGSVQHNKTAFLTLFAAMGISSLQMILTREWYTGASAAWQDIGMIACRLTGIGAFAIGIAAGIFTREVIRCRRRELRRRVT